MEHEHKLVFDEENLPPGKVTSLSSLKLTADLIRKKLKGDQLARFKTTAVGHLLDVDGSFKWQGQCIHGLILRKVEGKPLRNINALSFLLGNHVVEFTKKDFCLITGLKFGKTPRLQDPTDANCALKSKYFPNKDAILVGELKKALGGCDDEEDALKLAQVYFVERCLLGNEFNTKVTMGNLKLVEDQVACNDFPWGTLAYSETYEGIYKALRPEYRRGVNMQDRRKKGKICGKAGYHIKGFTLALQVWAYDTLPELEDIGFAVKEEPTKYPRILNWQTRKTPMFNQIMAIYMQEIVTIRDIVPTPDEMKKDYWNFGVEGEDKVEKEKKVDENERPVEGNGSQKECELEEKIHNLPKELKLCMDSNQDLTKRLESVERRYENEIKEVKKTMFMLEKSVVCHKEVSNGGTSLRKRKYAAAALKEVFGQDGRLTYPQV